LIFFCHIYIYAEAIGFKENVGGSENTQPFRTITPKQAFLKDTTQEPLSDILA